MHDHFFYKVTIGRPDIDLCAHGARINARMGLNTWAAFTGTDVFLHYFGSGPAKQLAEAVKAAVAVSRP